MIAVNGLLGRYPHSHLKKDTISLLRRLEERSDPDRPARYSVYEVLYALLQLEARHLGLRRDKHPEEYARFRYEFLASLAMWVPGKDPYIDGVRDALSRAAKHEDAELNSLLEALVQAEASRTSIEQRTETLEAKAERHEMAVFFHEAESLMFALDLVALGSTRTRGRKPSSAGHVDVIEQRKCHGWADGRLFDAGKSQDKRGG